MRFIKALLVPLTLLLLLILEEFLRSKGIDIRENKIPPFSRELSYLIIIGWPWWIISIFYYSNYDSLSLSISTGSFVLMFFLYTIFPFHPISSLSELTFAGWIFFFSAFLWVISTISCLITDLTEINYGKLSMKRGKKNQETEIKLVETRVIEKLNEAKELLELEVITQEEYDSIKVELSSDVLLILGDLTKIITKAQAIKRLKEAKELLQDDLITKVDYDSLKVELKLIIIRK